MRRSTGAATSAPSGPPSQGGKSSCSSQVKRVDRGRSPLLRRVKRPVPPTTPAWRTPMARPRRHSVTSSTSVSRKGPTRVSTSIVVPTPVRRPDVKRMAAASAIQSTWEARSETDLHTADGGAGMVVATRMRVTGRWRRP
jgi:hypothetical protein